MAVTREPAEFVSEGATLRGYLLLPDHPAPHPAIVVTHGFGFVKEIFADHDYPAVFAQAGYAVLVYDHRNTGESEGQPRQELDPVLQQRGYRDAITFLSARGDIDSARIGIWGTSYSGGHVLAVAAADRRVACVVSQVMTISGRVNLERRLTPEQLAAMRQQWADDRLGRLRGEPPAMVKQVDRSKPPQSEVERFVASLPGPSLARFDDQITVRTYELYDEYQPDAAIDRVSPTPLLMIVCTGDTVTPADLAIRAYHRALDPKRLLLLDGTHTDAYRRHFGATSSAAVEWFDTFLKPR